MKTSKIHGEAASTEKFPEHLKQITEGGNCDMRQIVIPDETAVYWKQQSKTIVICKEWSAKSHKSNREQFIKLFVVSAK